MLGFDPIGGFLAGLMLAFALLAMLIGFSSATVTFFDLIRARQHPAAPRARAATA
ncbi:MAG TPA: hypothetical protein VM580_19945 [Labilithrix sp.]|jgi:multisubunit Na+/H+ antiporter MnhB subunit|nr:hypothetical protein [Labilithrix sp.]